MLDEIQRESIGHSLAQIALKAVMAQKRRKACTEGRTTECFPPFDEKSLAICSEH
jgi:hypothetical protein